MDIAHAYALGWECSRKRQGNRKRGFKGSRYLVKLIKKYNYLIVRSHLTY